MTMTNPSTPFDTCMLSHNNNRDQSISCCLRQCDTRDLSCQEQCIDSFNHTIVESFGMFHLGRLEILSMLNILVTLWVVQHRSDLLPHLSDNQLLLLIILIQFVAYHVVKKTVS